MGPYLPHQESSHESKRDGDKDRHTQHYTQTNYQWLVILDDDSSTAVWVGRIGRIGRIGIWSWIGTGSNSRMISTGTGAWTSRISACSRIGRKGISTAAGKFIRFKVWTCNPFDADVSSNLPVASCLVDCLYLTISTRIIKRNSFISNTGTIETISWLETIVTGERKGGRRGEERERE